MNDKVVIIRNCFWEKLDADKNECKNDPTPSNVRTISCETCSKDDCNGKPMNPVIKNGNSINGRTNANGDHKDEVDGKNDTTFNTDSGEDDVN